MAAPLGGGSPSNRGAWPAQLTRPTRPPCRGVSISRVMQGQHSRADILAGAFLGTLVAVALVLRAIPRYVRVLSPDLDHTHDADKAVAVEEPAGQAV